MCSMPACTHVRIGITHKPHGIQISLQHSATRSSEQALSWYFSSLFPMQAAGSGTLHAAPDRCYSVQFQVDDGGWAQQKGIQAVES